MRFEVVASCLGVLLALSGCASDTVSPPPAPAQPPPSVEQPAPGPAETKVGLLLPLSGPAADLGQDMLRAAEMALFDVGANPVVLLPRDTGGTAAGSRLAADQAVAEGAGLILGPLFSRAVAGVVPVVRSAGIPALAFSNDASVASEGIYLLGFRPEEQVRRVVQYALSSGLTRIAGLAPDDPYGVTALTALREAVLTGGGELAQTLYYPPDLADPSAIVRQIAAYDQRRAALEARKQELAQQTDEVSQAELRRLETLDTEEPPPFDAILIADGGDRLRSVASLLTFYDVDPAAVRFLGTMRWQDDPGVLEEGALQGGWFAAPAPANMTAFQQRFQGVFGSPPQQLAALAYDATALAVIVARDLQDPGFLPPALTDPEGFTGATGLFRLRPDGLAEHGLAVLEVSRGTTTVVDPPPTSFVDQLARR